MEDSRLLPPQFQLQAEQPGARGVPTYIAGMTDRYAHPAVIFAVELE